MNDRELLELAAKAAGFEYWTTEDHDRLMVRGSDILCRPWDPIEDDGDALRLAVKLGLVVNPGCAHDEKNDLDDPYAATRRAIVRAAAEIGRQMNKDNIS